MITLYSTNCPRCKILEKKLDAAGVDYTVETNIQSLIDAGFKSAPVLQIDDTYYTFKDAVDWANSHKNECESCKIGD